MAIQTPINGATLRWARELSRVSTDELATAIGTKVGRVEDFEAGESGPTFRQLTLIADKLDRPLAFFFAPVPEQADIPETADFRGRADGEIPTALVREMKRAEQHRDTMLDFDGAPTTRIQLERLVWDNVAQQADSLRLQLGLTNAFTPPESQQNQVFNFWRGVLEGHGLLIFQTTRIPLESFRGLSIHHRILPIILLNGADSASGKTFTLLHEVAHIVNRTSGLCVLNDNVKEEAIANRFAASFLMPEDEFRESIPQNGSVDDAVHHLAAVFKVSTLAAGVRLRTLGLISDEQLAEVRLVSDQDWARARQAQKNKDGFVPQWRLRYRDLGSNYIGAVAEALDSRRIDLLDATYLLNARLPMVEQLLLEYHRAGGDD